MILILYLGVIFVGYVIGNYVDGKGVKIRGIGRLQTIVIGMLLFIMGCRIGADKEIVASLSTIGLQAFVITAFILVGSVVTVLCLRKMLGFDKEGNFIKRARSTKKIELEAEGGGNAGAEQFTAEQVSSSDTKEKSPKSWFMTVYILISVTVGIVSGFVFIPQWFIEIIGTLIVVLLSMLLFLVGVDIGIEGTIVENFKNAGWRVIVFPIGTIVGTLIGSVAASMVLSITAQDALCVGCGFGWYTMAPVMLSDYSTQISAISFMHNVMRELFGMLLIPVVARRVGYIETVSLSGSAAMDVCLPIVEKATRSDIAVYSFISGVILTIAVPIMVGIMMNI